MISRRGRETGVLILPAPSVPVAQPAVGASGCVMEDHGSFQAAHPQIPAQLQLPAQMQLQLPLSPLPFQRVVETAPQSCWSREPLPHLLHFPSPSHAFINGPLLNAPQLPSHVICFLWDPGRDTHSYHVFSSRSLGYRSHSSSVVGIHVRP